MHACQSGPDELLRHVGEPIPFTLFTFSLREIHFLSDLVEHIARALRNSTRQFSAGITVERAPAGDWSGLCYLRKLERLAVVERCMSATMMHGDGMLARNPVEVANGWSAFVLQLCVVEEIALDPVTRRCLLRLGFQLFDDAVDRDVLNLVRIPYECLVKNHCADRVAVTVDESGQDRHPLRIDDPCASPRETPHLGRRSNGRKLSVA